MPSIRVVLAFILAPLAGVILLYVLWLVLITIPQWPPPEADAIAARGGNWILEEFLFAAIMPVFALASVIPVVVVAGVPWYLLVLRRGRVRARNCLIGGTVLGTVSHLVWLATDFVNLESLTDFFLTPIAVLLTMAPFCGLFGGFVFWRVIRVAAQHSATASA